MYKSDIASQKEFSMSNIRIRCGKLKNKGRIYKGFKLHPNGVVQDFFQCSGTANPLNSAFGFGD
jgi:hypothetical protein